MIAPCFDEHVACATTEWCFGNFLGYCPENISTCIHWLVLTEEHQISYLTSPSTWTPKKSPAGSPPPPPSPRLRVSAINDHFAGVFLGFLGVTTHRSNFDETNLNKNSVIFREKPLADANADPTNAMQILGIDAILMDLCRHKAKCKMSVAMDQPVEPSVIRGAVKSMKVSRSDGFTSTSLAKTSSTCQYKYLSVRPRGHTNTLERRECRQ